MPFFPRPCPSKSLFKKKKSKKKNRKQPRIFAGERRKYKMKWVHEEQFPKNSRYETKMVLKDNRVEHHSVSEPS